MNTMTSSMTDTLKLNHTQLIPCSSPMIPSGSHNPHKWLPSNMPDRYQGGYGAAPYVPTCGDIHSSNTTYLTDYTPYMSQTSCSYSPVPDPCHHSRHLPSMHRSQQTLLSTTDSGKNDAQRSKQSDSLEKAPIEGRGKQESLDSAPYSPQNLTKELQGRSPHPVASGGSGDIWKCYLVRTNGTVQVAVKTIRAFESDDGAEMLRKTKRVRRKLKVWGRLKHDCILPLWGVADNFGPYPAMVCPWVDNGALTGYLERHQDSLSPLDKFSILNDIALGLQYLHRKSIVHGDLTGSNVLVHGNGRACLSDFGLSTILLEFVGPSYLTSSIRGNIRWAAAELFMEPVDEEEEEATVSLSPECDIYSFGSIFLQVLTCKVPYYNVKNDYVVLGLVIRGKKPEPPEDSVLAPVHWEFIQRCWLPRASRPSIGKIVIFVARERCLAAGKSLMDSSVSSATRHPGQLGHAHRLPQGFFDDARGGVHSSVTRGTGRRHAFTASSTSRPHTLLGRLSSLFRQTNADGSASTELPRYPREVQVALVQDKQSLYVAPRQEQTSDMAQRIENPAWWTRCILVVCCVSRATPDTDIVN